MSQITFAIKNLLEDEFLKVEVEGEISNGKLASSGHYYFSLKDAEAVLSCVMFKQAMDKTGFIPKDGAKVKARGKITVYAQRGNYQLLCTSMLPSGEGDLLAQIEERKQRLAREGLFDREKKKKIPSFPSTILILTSPTGAAVKDILRVIKRRGFQANIKVLPIPVQGESAGPKIAAMISYANQWGLGDVMILGRGGGSLEDLAPFSEEVVVRAVAESEIPVISAVGHEIDWALTDFAADLRAATPTAAGELVCPSLGELQGQLMLWTRSLTQRFAERLSQIRYRLQAFSTGYRRETLFYLTQPKRQRLDDGIEGLFRNIRDKFSNYRNRLKTSQDALENLSPQSVLKRGYSIVQVENRAITKAQDLEENQKIKIIMAQGSLGATVNSIE